MPELDSAFVPDRPLRILSALMTRESVPHALLFTGIDGVGKAEAARRFATALNCLDCQGPLAAGNGWQTDGFQSAVTPCGNCRSCRKIRSGNHPDVISIKPVGPSIRINAIRELCQTLTLKPYEAKARVVIISDAHAMNPAAANALLKMLEEPPERTILILTADRVSSLLPTIVSRCQQIRFTPLPADKLAARLIAEGIVDKDAAAILAVMADGSVSRARALHRSGWLERRSWLLSQLKRLPELPLGSIMTIAAQLAINRQALERYLKIIYTWARDMAVCRAAPRQVINRDALNDLQTAAARHDTASALEQADLVYAAMRALQANANPRLAAEVLLLRLADSGRMPYGN